MALSRHLAAPLAAALHGARALSAPRRWSSGGARESYDVAIIGGGVIGSSVALHLAALAGSGKRVAVFERDATYEWASAPRSAGGIRQQFSLPVNIQLSLYGVDFLKTGLKHLCEGVDVETDVQFRENGYLLLAPPGDGETALRENVATQHATGATWITLMDPAALKSRFPWLSTEGVALGAFGERNEGYFDPWALLQALRKGASARGVRYIEGDVAAFNRGPDGKIASISLGDGSEVTVGAVVNAAGAGGGRIVDLCGPGVQALPVRPRKRCIWLVRTDTQSGGPSVPPDNTPLTIDASGVYFRSDCAGRFLCGVSPRPDADPDCTQADLEQVDHELFEDVVWPMLAARVPAFEALRVESSWAGFYEYNTLDQNGVVGFHPDVPNMLIACGFSGHGLQQAPGVGRGCAELLTHGRFQTVDMSCLGYDRIVRNEPLRERSIF